MADSIDVLRLVLGPDSAIDKAGAEAISRKSKAEAAGVNVKAALQLLEAMDSEISLTSVAEVLVMLDDPAKAVKLANKATKPPKPPKPPEGARR